MKDPAILHLSHGERAMLLTELYALQCRLGARTLQAALERLSLLVNEGEREFDGMTVDLNDHEIYWTNLTDSYALVNSPRHLLSYVKRAFAAQYAERLAALEADTPF